MAKVVLESNDDVPPLGICRVFTWLAAIVAAPLSGGLSLGVPLVMEGVYGKARQDIKDLTDAEMASKIDGVGDDIHRQVLEGHTRGGVRVPIDLGEHGFGKTTRVYRYRIDSESEASRIKEERRRRLDYLEALERLADRR